MSVRALLAALAVLAGPGPAAADDMTMDMGAASGAADRAFAASMARMMTDMAVKPTGDADRDFVLMMMPHQGAIDVAKVELRFGKDPVLRKLATDVVKAQEGEIAALKAWLAGAGK